MPTFAVAGTSLSDRILLPAQPVFIALEGLDGAGKSTVGRLAAALLDAECLSTPVAGLRSVRDRIESEYADSPLARALFYASNVACISDRVRRNLANGRSTVVDRYWLSTLAYASLDGVRLDLGAVEAGLLLPDATFFLEVPRAVRRARMTGRGLVTPGDLDSLKPDTESAVMRAYESAARHWCPGRFHRVPAGCQNPDALAVELVERVAREVQ
jgi:dTMP kinase